MIVTWSPAVQPPATPRTRTVRPPHGAGHDRERDRRTARRRLTSRPLATTSPIPTPAPADGVVALSTKRRPRGSVTQRQAMLPPAEVAPEYTLLPDS